MTWTNQPPTVPGWYWCKFAKATNAGAAVFKVGYRLQCKVPKKRFPYCVWAGPIPEPDETKEDNA